MQLYGRCQVASSRLPWPTLGCSASGGAAEFGGGLRGAVLSWHTTEQLAPEVRRRVCMRAFCPDVPILRQQLQREVEYHYKADPVTSDLGAVISHGRPWCRWVLQQCSVPMPRNFRAFYSAVTCFQLSAEFFKDKQAVLTPSRRVQHANDCSDAVGIRHLLLS